jgi:hypothetical protein
MNDDQERILEQNRVLLAKLSNGLRGIRAGTLDAGLARHGWETASDTLAANELYLRQMRDDGAFTERIREYQSQFDERRDDFRELM